MKTQETEECSNFIDELVSKLKQDKNLFNEKLKEHLGDKWAITTKSVPSFKAGIYAKMIEVYLKERNLSYKITNYSRSNETSLVYRMFAFGYNESLNCIIEGMYFVSGENPMVVLTYSGVNSWIIDIYTKENDVKNAESFICEVSSLARINDPYKNALLQTNYNNGLQLEFLAPVEETWSDIVLSLKVVNDLQVNVDTVLSNWNELKEKVGITGRSILFIGEPGTGKSFTLRLVCGSCDSITRIWATSKVLRESWLVQDLFSIARELAPTLLILEDLDLVGKSREFSESSSLGELLNQLQGGSYKNNLLIIATCNDTKTIDKALIRSGRFDVAIEFEKPDEVARIKILKILLKDFTKDVNVYKIAKQTEGLTGADLHALVINARLRALKAKRNLIFQDFE